MMDRFLNVRPVTRMLMAIGCCGIYFIAEPALSGFCAAQDVSDAEPETTEVRLAGARVVKDITYATVDDEPLLCDVYLPLQDDQAEAGEEEQKRDLSKLRPAVIVIHGGGWALGDKWSVSNYARTFAANGMVAISINYRHAPRYKFPAQVDDVRTALAWVHDHADKYQIDKDRIGMFGYSAGGHLSCMIGTLVDAPWETVKLTTQWTKDDPRWAKLPKLCGIVGGGAPCDFRDLPIDNTAISYFLGGSRRELPEIYKAASPAEHASSGDVPTLFIHGTQDLIVPIASSRILFEAQRSAGVASKFLPLEGPGHMLTFIKQDSVNAAVSFLLSTLVGEVESEAVAGDGRTAADGTAKE